MSVRIAFATYRELPDLTRDDQLVVAALRELGIDGQAAVWNDPAVHWSGFDAVLVRSIWDYHREPQTFTAWLDRLERARVPVWNPPMLLRWNMHKRYLLDLEARGIPIVPTAVVERGAAVQLADVLHERGWSDAIVKPAVSASAWQTWRTTNAESDQARFAALLQLSDLLIQPFVRAIQQAGEWSFVFLGGSHSHAVLKRPQADDWRVQSEWGGALADDQPPQNAIRQATAITDQIDGSWLYARVDGIVIDDVLHLMELELIEPALFLQRHPPSIARFAEAINAVVAG
jgi:glutathione synthase/RimK-type ligase-like ATP-grasp enzyme